MPLLEFDSTDLAATEEFLSSAYTAMSIGGRAESTRARVSREAAGTISVDDLAFDYDMSHDTEAPIGKLCLCSVHDGTIVRRYAQGSEGRFGSGDVFMYAPHDRSYAGVIGAATYNLIMLDPVLLDQVAGVDPGAGTASIRLTADRPASAAHARQFRAVVRYLRNHALSDPLVRESPLVVASASQLLAATVLNTFPNTGIIQPTSLDARDAHPATLRRAIAYIEAHVAEPLTLAEIAVASGTTGRSVEVAFQRHLATTPMQYVRRVRLDHAHRDLQRAGPGDPHTIRTVAARWGFPSPGEFIADYREAYGHSPLPGPARGAAHGPDLTDRQRRADEAAHRSLDRHQDAQRRAANLESIRADLRRRTDRNHPSA